MPASWKLSLLLCCISCFLDYSFLVYFPIAQRWVYIFGGGGGAGWLVTPIILWEKVNKEIFVFKHCKSKNVFTLSLYLIDSLGAEYEVENYFLLGHLKALLYSLWVSPLAVERTSNDLIPDLWMWPNFFRIFSFFWFTKISQSCLSVRSFFIHGAKHMGGTFLVLTSEKLVLFSY